MANIKVQWVLPTTRESGKPLKVTDISHVRIEVSADEGASFALINDFPPDVLETLVQDADFGVWVFRAACADTKGRVSEWVVGSTVIEDTTPPSVVTLTLSLV
jgi:hypothetical protein